MLAQRRISAMISSTAVDLPEHRKQVLMPVCAKASFQRAWSPYLARDADRYSRVIGNGGPGEYLQLESSGWRYGHIPKRHEISITEIEFQPRGGAKKDPNAHLRGFIRSTNSTMRNGRGASERAEES